MQNRCKKAWLAVWLVLCLAVGGTALAGCKDRPSTPPDAPTVRSIALSGQKTQFDLDEAFSVGGLAVTATYANGTTGTLEEGRYTVDASAYRGSRPGDYQITVTVKGTDVSAAYTVTVYDRIPEAPVVRDRVFAYNGLDPQFSRATVYYEAATGCDEDWFGRYSVSVWPAGKKTEAQQVGMVAAYSQIHGSQMGLSTVGMFDFEGTAVVRVTTKFAFEKVDIRPYSLGIAYKRAEDADNTIEFTLTRPCNISVEFDGDTCRNLTLFSSSIRPYSRPSEEWLEQLKTEVGDGQNLIVVEPGDVDLNEVYAKYSYTQENVIVFGKGLYYMRDGSSGPRGAALKLPGNAKIYIHGDAALFTTLQVEDRKNVHIEGRGYVTGQLLAQSHTLYVENSKNVTAEGIVLYHSYGWTNVCVESQDITYRSIRLAGQRRNNNDGFDLCNSSDVLVDDCWIRTIDDCVTIKGRFGSVDTRMHIQNIVVQDSTLWNYQGGNGIVVGSESCTDVYDNIVFRNIDIIHNTTNRALAMEILDSATVTNVVFDDIRLELENTFSQEDRPDVTPTSPYPSDYDNRSPLIQLELMPNEQAFYGTDTEDGIIDGVTFNNISYWGNEDRKIFVSGAGPDHLIENVTFNNFFYNGTPVTDRNIDDYKSNTYANYRNIRYTQGDWYFRPLGTVVDDKDMAFTGARVYTIGNEQLTGGGYGAASVRLTDSLSAKFSVSKEGFYMPTIGLAVGDAGGLFEVYFDGKYSGTVNTYSTTSSFTQFSLPLDYIAAGEHTLTFTAVSVPHADFEGYMLSIGVDYVDLIDMGQNFIEFESLTGTGAAVTSDGHASGGFAVDAAAPVGGEIVFRGVNERARGAQLVLSYLAGPDKGIYKFYYNGVLISTDIDMYAPYAEYRTAVLDTVYLVAGEYAFSAGCVGKNAASSATALRLDCMKTWHLPVSKTWKGGYEGIYGSVGVSEGVTVQTGSFRPIGFGNVKGGSRVTVTTVISMPIDGVYEQRWTVTDFDPQAFEIYQNGKKVAYDYANGVISFTQPIAFGVSMRYEIRCVADDENTHDFQWVKCVTVPVDPDKTVLRALVEAEDSRTLPAQAPDWLKANFSDTLHTAKEVLFSRLSTAEDIARAVEVLQTAASRFSDAETLYNRATLIEGEVVVRFTGASLVDVAVLYLDSGKTTQSFYQLIDLEGKAVFDLSAYVGSDVKLYAEIIGKPMAVPVIEVGEKIGEALEFAFDDTYYTAEIAEAFVFDTLEEAKTLTATFDVASAGEVAMFSVRDAIDRTIKTLYTTIGADGRAAVSLDGLPLGKNLRVVAVTANGAATTVEAEGVLLASADVGKTLAGTAAPDGVGISSTVMPDEDGVLRASAKSGWREAVVTIGFSGAFDSIKLDAALLSYCGSGGRDTIYVYDAAGSAQLTLLQSVPNDAPVRDTFALSSAQCGAGLTLKVWYGCVGDHAQCMTAPPHAAEEIVLGKVRFYGTLAGVKTELRLLGGEPVAVPSEVKAFDGLRFDDLRGARTVTATTEAAIEAGTLVMLDLRGRDGDPIGQSYALAEGGDTLTFTGAGLAHSGPVYGYLLTQAGPIKAVSAEAQLVDKTAFGKLLTSGTGGIWKAQPVNAALNLSEEGVIYTDAAKLYRQNYWIPNENRPLNGYDYRFTSEAALETIESISIPYAFKKICNCGGGDWFYIVNGGKIVGSFSCQDQPLGDYTGTVVLQGETLALCTESTFYLFYGMGCSNGTAAHAGETLALGDVVTSYRAGGVYVKAVAERAEQYPQYVEKTVTKGYALGVPYGTAKTVQATVSAVDGTQVTADVYAGGTKLNPTALTAAAENGQAAFDVSAYASSGQLIIVFGTEVQNVTVLSQESMDVGVELYKACNGKAPGVYEAVSKTGALKIRYSHSAEHRSIDEQGRFSIPSGRIVDRLFWLDYPDIAENVVSIVQQSTVYKVCNCGGPDGTFFHGAGDDGGNLSAVWEQPGFSGPQEREFTTAMNAAGLAGKTGITYEQYLGCVNADTGEWIDYGTITAIMTYGAAQVTMIL